ncbi:TonB-dependent receptor [Chitinophaga nivalis]|uniref:TonB-dependent receptor n=1 Tax=Chitinophaga nivalis TaxID=2991709 RepID=A0ABT3IMV9_9BACT|nr:TonB-dependent receptor [Chitinophaga nivalis]MCW3465067.1 TonB-dependent receptor [Chitinophaga nivalis]MCW3485241.1 TonB-dependent receptor [Chitinophaga nivalis]
MMKKLCLLNVLLLSLTTLYAQKTKDSNGTIHGTITTSDGSPVPNVTIRIERARWGDISNEKGAYTISNVKPGNWVLKVSTVVTATQEKNITVTAGSDQEINFVLNDNAARLQEVIVSTGKARQENKNVAKMPLKNLENPQVYNTVSAEIMKQQGITNYDDALRNVPGLTRTWESTGRAGDGASYFALRGFDAQPTLYNGLPGLTSGNLDPADIEAIEVIKGPSGTLFGGSFYSYGGMINTITKKPYFNFGGEVAYNFGSFGLNRVTADINTPLSKKEKIALRVNTAYHSENSFQDAGFKKSFFIAPSLVYEVSERLTFHLLTEFLQEDRAVAPVFFHSGRTAALDFKNIQELNLNNKLSFTSNELTIKTPRFNLQAQALYKISEQWTSQTVISRGAVKSDGIYTYIWDDDPGNNWFSQYFQKENQTTTTTDIQQNFNGDFMIGKLRNRLLIGLDYFNRNVVNNGTNGAVGRNVTPQGDVQEFVHDTIPAVNLTRAAIDRLLAPNGMSNSNINNSSYSAYVSDVLNITPGLMAMLSLRADYFDTPGEKTTGKGSYNQFALSPKFGVVYQPVLNKVSVFANYMNAFINVAPREVANANGTDRRMKSFKPEHANQWEAGVKANLFADKLRATVSVYDIKVADRVVPDATNPNNSLQGGKVGSKGIEIDISAHPAAGFNLIAGYSFNETKIIEGNPLDFYSQPGRAPGGQGPQHLANFWGTYTITKGQLKNFGLGLGGNYAGEYKVIDNAQTGEFFLPAYALLNGSIYYNSDKFRITLNVNNITNEVYYIGYWSVNPQRPRNFAASVAYKF